MNRIAVAEELVRVAEELTAVERDVADPWLTAEQVAEMCPRCAELMASKGLKRIRATLLVGKNRKAQWENLPSGWTEASLKKFWSSLPGDRVHKITKCISKINGTGIDDPGAFCASLARKLE